MIWYCINTAAFVLSNPRLCPLLSESTNPTDVGLHVALNVVCAGCLCLLDGQWQEHWFMRLVLMKSIAPNARFRQSHINALPESSFTAVNTEAIETHNRNQLHAKWRLAYVSEIHRDKTTSAVGVANLRPPMVISEI